MSKTYNLNIISKSRRKLLEVWKKIDPIDKKECLIYYKKKKYEWNINIILEEPCKKILWY